MNGDFYFFFPVKWEAISSAEGGEESVTTGKRSVSGRVEVSWWNVNVPVAFGDHEIVWKLWFFSQRFLAAPYRMIEDTWIDPGLKIFSGQYNGKERSMDVLETWQEYGWSIRQWILAQIEKRRRQERTDWLGRKRKSLSFLMIMKLRNPGSTGCIS